MGCVYPKLLATTMLAEIPQTGQLWLAVISHSHMQIGCAKFPKEVPLKYIRQEFSFMRVVAVSKSHASQCFFPATKTEGDRSFIQKNSLRSEHNVVFNGHRVGAFPFAHIREELVEVGYN